MSLFYHRQYLCSSVGLPSFIILAPPLFVVLSVLSAGSFLQCRECGGPGLWFVGGGHQGPVMSNSPAKPQVAAPEAAPDLRAVGALQSEAKRAKMVEPKESMKIK